MGLKPFGLGERDRGWTERGKLIRSAFENRRPLHEIEDAEPGGKASRARRRQHVIRSGDIVADRFRRVLPDEDRSRMAHRFGELFAVSRDDFEMFGRKRIDQRGVRRERLGCAATARSTSAASSSSSVMRIAWAAASCSA